MCDSRGLSRGLRTTGLAGTVYIRAEKRHRSG